MLLMIAILRMILLAGGYPLLPFVIGEDRYCYEDERKDAEEKFHGWE